MAKRYIVTEDKGCGCGSFIGFVIVVGILMTIAPYLLMGLAVILIVAAIIYIPRYRENKRRNLEEAEIAERERQYELKKRRAEIEEKERKLNSKANQQDDNWEDF